MPHQPRIRIAAPATLAEAIARCIGPHARPIHIDPQRDYLWHLSGGWPGADILLLATNLPEAAALPLAEQVARARPSIRIVILTQTKSAVDARLAALFGACGAVSRYCGLSTLLTALEAAADGVPWYFGETTPEGGTVPSLKPSPREIEVLKALTSWPTRESAAAALRIGIDSFDRRVASLRRKLAAPGDAQLPHLAGELGLVAVRETPATNIPWLIGSHGFGLDPLPFKRSMVAPWPLQYC